MQKLFANNFGLDCIPSCSCALALHAKCVCVYVCHAVVVFTPTHTIHPTCCQTRSQYSATCVRVCVCACVYSRADNTHSEENERETHAE